MGTTWSVRLSAARNADLHAVHAGIHGQLDLVVRQMSTWQADSDISRYNHADAGRWLRIPAEFFAVLECARAIAHASDGAFDPSVGALVGAWGFGADAGPPHAPAAAQLDAARASVDWRRIQLRQDSSYAGACEVLQPGGLRLDLSAIAKGFAVDLVVDYLRDAGIAGALVEIGGELSGYGRKPDGTAWRVLVEAGPEEDDHRLPPRVLELDGIAVATSGDRWHHYERDGRRYTHTIDPRSGDPVEHAPMAVTVVAQQAMHADGWATALTVLGADAGFALAERQALAVRYLVRTPDGSLRERMTAAFQTHLAP
ncbi:MAG: FAD:protein FMN transferase [Lysobacteraceae bacterium]|nr:MAG: FAD:protein FMN transferase [Xanthomonadaceae bacterium]